MEKQSGGGVQPNISTSQRGRTVPRTYVVVTLMAFDVRSWFIALCTEGSS